MPSLIIQQEKYNIKFGYKCAAIDPGDFFHDTPGFSGKWSNCTMTLLIFYLFIINFFLGGGGEGGRGTLPFPIDNIINRTHQIVYS